ncbi:MAG: hypothetical protein M0Z58_07755 [Nitrospiraceae bacterium]|nr:hypothetical protein [Nitrospiraceae bacterium]
MEGQSFRGDRYLVGDRALLETGSRKQGKSSLTPSEILRDVYDFDQFL